MKINQIIVESDQLDELSAGDIARGVGTAVGKTAQGIGAVAGGVKGAWDAARSGYQSGKSFVGGQRVGRPSGGAAGNVPPLPTGGTATPSAPTAPAGANNPPRTFADMDDTELENLRKFVDRELTIRRSANAPGGTPAAPGGAPGTPAGGGTPAAPRPASGGSAPRGGSTQPTRNQIIQGPDGRPYQWLGNQWAAYNPATGRAGQVARRDLGAQLTQAVTSGQATPYTPPASGRPAPSPAAANTPPTGGRPAPSPAGNPTAAPASATSPYGNVTSEEQAFIAAREREGASPEQIKTALENRRTRAGRRLPPAQLNTVGDTPGFRADMPMSQADPESFAAGQQRRAELDARSAAAVARGSSGRTAQAANEGVYSRFLGRNI